MDEWAGFYERLFNFREVRYFDIEGQATGVESKAMTSPCGKIRIPINEEATKKGQIQEYLDMYHGEGVQHIALAATSTTRWTSWAWRASSCWTPATPTTSCCPAHPGRLEPIGELQSRNILVDGRQASCCCRSSAKTSWADLLRVHPAQGQRRLRRGQLQGPVRDHGAGPDSPRR
jgi:4-hydroxyphenylpyruvate dioxygenase